MMGDVSTGTDPIVRTNLIGTTAFTASALIAAIVFTGPTRVQGVVVALALFAVGVFSFLWSYVTAVQRSRTDNIAVAQLYFLTGGSAPKPVRRLMMSALAVQVVVAFSTAIARSRTDGKPGSTLAFGILVPMFGLGLNGLWCSRHGTFSARQTRTERDHEPDPERDPAADDASGLDPELESGPERDSEPEVEPNSGSVPTSDNEMEQNSRHG